MSPYDEGYEALICGLPVESNPYDPVKEPTESFEWEAGWLDADIQESGDTE